MSYGTNFASLIFIEISKHRA